MSAVARSSPLRPPLQHFHHFHVVWVGRIVIVSHLVILLRRLENQRDSAAATILHQPLEGLLSNTAVPYENVPILIRSELPFAVVEMEEGRRLPRVLLELVEH